MSPDALAGLRDYHLPEPMPWWPPAPGWWLLALGAALLALLLWLRHRRRRAQARAPLLALRELARLRERWQRDGDDTAFVRELAQLIRRYAISRWPADDAAGLTGADWRGYLAQKCADAPAPVRAALDGALGEAVTRWPYQPCPAQTSTELDPADLAESAAALLRHGAAGTTGTRA